LSEELRNGGGAALGRRRGIIVLSLMESGATFASVPLAYPEAREAFERLRRAGQAGSPARTLRSLARSA
jgi:hypothetical protein